LVHRRQFLAQPGQALHLVAKWRLCVGPLRKLDRESILTSGGGFRVRLQEGQIDVTDNAQNIRRGFWQRIDAVDPLSIKAGHIIELTNPMLDHWRRRPHFQHRRRIRRQGFQLPEPTKVGKAWPGAEHIAVDAHMVL
jgi:hypothetical protein